MIELSLCSCAEFYGEHHPECPAQREYSALFDQLARANERDAARWVWLIVNGEQCFGSLWREATVGDIDAAMAPRSGVEGEQS